MLICTHSNSAADLYVEDIHKEWTSMFLVVVYCTKLMCIYDTPYCTCCMISEVGICVCKCSREFDKSDIELVNTFVLNSMKLLKYSEGIFANYNDSHTYVILYIYRGSV